MASIKKIKAPSPVASVPQPLTVQRNAAGEIFSPLRNKWLVETPEESVRQTYLCVLVNEYGFVLDQIGEEFSVTERGSGQARADFLIWRSPEDRLPPAKPPLMVIECKADNVQINAKTYTQGANYAQYCKARFFVTHNNRETKFWRVDHARMMPNFDEIENIPHASASDREIEDLIGKLRVFKEEEFADLLQKCHDVIRDRESHDPTKAFDETSKILFVKVWVERELKEKRRRKNIFSVEFLDEQVGDDPVNDLFEKTKRHYESAALFSTGERINLRPETSREIVRLLQSYNLSDTSEDIKGIAFERFLGRTFRGEIGQFFTPRPIVEFMIQMLDPQEGHVICDPAAGSGGFLIRFFEIVRQSILQKADDEYRAYELELSKKKRLSEADRAKALLLKYHQLQEAIDQKIVGSRTWKLANECIFGTDKNDRMARTSKMNMIMHGDGHGGIHHWNGFLNVNGIFEERFDLVLTNPPFGSKLVSDELVLANDISLPDAVEEIYSRRFKVPYQNARAALKAAINKPIASLFELPSGDGSIKTELLFIERCLRLLKPGGRLGIVLPESVFNNPTTSYVRRFVEDRAQILAVVSLPVETFVASGANVKTSLLFLRKFDLEQSKQYEGWRRTCRVDADLARKTEVEKLRKIVDTPVVTVDGLLKGIKTPTAAQKADASDKAKKANAQQKKLAVEARRQLQTIEQEVQADVRQRLRKKARYPLFMYEAERVGITATGAADDNELFPNPRVPAGVAKTALDLYREFALDPKPFLDATKEEGAAA